MSTAHRLVSGSARVAALLMATAGIARSVAADVPVAAKKLVVVDKLATAGTAKTVFVAKDPGVSKGVGTDVEEIAVRLDVVYADGSAGGGFTAPAGTASGWVVNRANVAKFVNPAAPGGATQTKVAVVKPGKLLKLVGKGIGDVPIDVVGAGAPEDDVYATYCVTNGGGETCHCAAFSDCAFKSIALGTGAKLVCKAGTGNATCRDGDGCCPGGCTSVDDDDCEAATCLVDQGLTVLDTCTGLEWEKKDTAIGSGSDPMNPHDVDNAYAWVGVCSVSGAFCQPTPGAEAACRAQTPGAVWASAGCNQCPAGEGTCAVSGFSAVFGAFTTIWHFVDQLNAAAFAGHVDWRLPSTAGTELEPTGEPAEVETLVDPTSGQCSGGTGACVDPVFGPTAELFYWTSSTNPASPATGYVLHAAVSSGGIGPALREFVAYVRAVR